MKRLYEALLLEYLNLFPCVAVIGPRQCGKTTLLGTLPKDWRVYDLERNSDLQLVERDPDLFFRLNPRRAAIDEAQVLPAIFPALRVAVDQHRGERGRFVITGSSSPGLLTAVSESLAGRVGIIEMSPLSFAEVSGKLDSPFFSLLIEKAKAPDLIAKLKPHGDLQTIHDYWLRGGYPEPWLRADSRYQTLWMDQYAGTYLFRDVARLFHGLNESKYRLFVQMLAGLSGSIINYSEVARTLGVSQPTVRDYFEIAHGTFVWRRLPPFVRDVTKRVIKHPKGYLRDTGLLHHLLRIARRDDLLSHPRCGASWEAMVIEEVLRGLNARGVSFDSYYYRTGAGAEVDLVLDTQFGLIPVEIKYGTGAGSYHELRGIEAFVKERRCRLGIVINNAERPALYSERIAVVPFSCL
jgi:predicted AAA+ superfamily ATPase